MVIEPVSGVAGAHQLWDLPLALSGDEGHGAVVPRYVEHPLAKFAGVTVRCPLTLVLAALSFYLIERPLMGWGKKRLSAI